MPKGLHGLDGLQLHRFLYAVKCQKMKDKDHSSPLVLCNGPWWMVQSSAHEVMALVGVEHHLVSSRNFSWTVDLEGPCYSLCRILSPHQEQSRVQVLTGLCKQTNTGFFFFLERKKKKVKKNNCDRVPGWVTVNLRKQEKRAAPYIWVKTNWSLSPGTQTCLYTELVKKSSLKVTGDK